MPLSRVPRLRASLLASAALLALLTAAPCTEAATLRAVGSPYMPAMQRVQLQPQEFTDTDNQLVPTITQALAARGIQVDPNASLVLTYDTEISDLTQGSGGGGVNDTELGAPGDDQDLFPGGDVGPLQGEYPAEEFGGTITLGGSARQRPMPIRSYSLDFVLTGQGDIPIWQGSIHASLPEQDPVGIARSMVLPLVATMGQTVNPPARVQLQVPPFE